MPAAIQYGLAYWLAGEQIVAEIDRIEPRVLRAMRGQPTPCRTAFAVLFVVPVLGHNELRLQWHNPDMAGHHQSGGEQGVKILDLVLTAFTMGTVRAMDLVGAVEFRSVQR